MNMTVTPQAALSINSREEHSEWQSACLLWPTTELVCVFGKKKFSL